MLRRHSPAQSAFTLVELLVVIGIIAVLLGMLLPSLAAGRRSANAVVCLGNLRQIGTAVLMYAQDNKGYLPRVSMTARSKPPLEPFFVRPWGEAIMPYLGKGDFDPNAADAGDTIKSLFLGVYRCPGDAVHMNENWTYSAANYAALYKGHWSYGRNVIFDYNEYWGAPPWNPGVPYKECHKLSQILRASETILFAEINATSMSDHFMVDEWNLDGSDNTVDQTRHGNKANYIFCDGHAAPEQFKDMFDPPHGINNFDPQWAR